MTTPTPNPAPASVDYVGLCVTCNARWNPYHPDCPEWDGETCPVCDSTDIGGTEAPNDPVDDEVFALLATRPTLTGPEIAEIEERPDIAPVLALYRAVQDWPDPARFTATDYFEHDADALAAIQNGGDYEPDVQWDHGDEFPVLDGGDLPDWRDDPDPSWYREATNVTFYVEAGDVVPYVWRLDSCGNFDAEPLDPAEVLSYNNHTGATAAARAWREYDAFVAATGRDPLGNVRVETTRQPTTWTLELRTLREDGRPALYRASLNGHATEPDLVPLRVLRFFHLRPDEHDDYRSAHTETEILDYASKDGAPFRAWTEGSHLFVEYATDVPEDPASVAERRKAAARDRLAT